MIGSIGRLMLEHGKGNPTTGLGLGYIYIGFGHFFGGYGFSRRTHQERNPRLPDPLLSCSRKRLLGCVFLEGNMEEAEKNWVEVCKYCEEHGAGTVELYLAQL